MATIFRTLPHILHLHQLSFASDEINRSGRKQRRRQRDAQSCSIEVIVGCLANMRDEPITALRYRLNIVTSIGSRTEHLSHRRNATGQAALFHSNAGPDPIE